MKAYYWMRNFSKPEVINLMCYGSKFPHKLTTHQRLTRIYRHFLRRSFDIEFLNIKASPDEFFGIQHKAEADIRKALYCKQDDPVFINTLKKYESWVESEFDPTMIIHDCRPYSPINGRFYIFDNDELNYDPFGYYKPKSVAGRVPKESGFLYFEDFPQDSAQWSLRKTITLNDQDTDQHDFETNQSQKRGEVNQ